MCDVTDAGQSFPTEPMRRDGGQVTEVTELTGGESLTDNVHAISLEEIRLRNDVISQIPLDNNVTNSKGNVKITVPHKY